MKHFHNRHRRPSELPDRTGSSQGSGDVSGGPDGGGVSQEGHEVGKTEVEPVVPGVEEGKDDAAGDADAEAVDVESQEGLFTNVFQWFFTFRDRFSSV